MSFRLLYFHIINTPQFQRLRYLKQLGNCHYVYPGATHTRFEHSLGVCHLAEMMVKSLQEKNPELVDEKDVLCVAIAGLCHDLGHGPISHMWEKFMKVKMENTANAEQKEWNHESGSIQMFDIIWENLSEEVKREFQFEEKDLKFIKELIYNSSTSNSEEWPFEGRTKEKSFLYEIVANKRNGIDVDKWDYFQRDCHYLGCKDSFDYQRILKSARVIKDERTGLNHICFREKEEFNLYQMFHIRWVLYRKAYQHRVVRIIDKMLLDAFLLVDEIIKLPGRDGKLLSLSECATDMEAFSKLNDSLINRIMLESDPGFLRSNRNLSDEQKKKLENAREIIERIQKRNLYTEIGCVLMPKDNEKAQEIKGSMEVLKERYKNNIYINVSKIDYGMKDRDPIQEVKFYNKASPDRICSQNEELISRMLPSHFQEEFLYCLCLSEDQSIKHSMKNDFKNRCKEKGFKLTSS